MFALLLRPRLWRKKKLTNQKGPGLQYPGPLVTQALPPRVGGRVEPGSPLLYDFAVFERISFVTDAGVPVRTTIEGVVVVLVLGVK